MTALRPPAVALERAALVRHRPLLRGLRARADRLAGGPLLLRRLNPPRVPAGPTAPRLRWHVPVPPFLRSAALGATHDAPDTGPDTAPASPPGPFAGLRSARKQRP